MMSGPQSDKARAYLLQHPTATPYDVAAGSGCSARTARRVVRRQKAHDAWLRGHPGRASLVSDMESAIFFGAPERQQAIMRGFGVRVGFDYGVADGDRSMKAEIDECGRVAFTDITDQPDVAPGGVFGCYAVFPDIHAPYHDDRALDTAINHVIKRHKPTGVILPGDFADNYEFSRYPGTPRMSAFSEVNAVKAVLKRVADAFPGGDNTALMGNHEMRFVRYMQVNAPKAAEVLGDKVPEVFGLSEMGFKFHDNQESWARGGGYFKIGKLVYVHGHELPGCAGKYAAQRVAELHRGNILFAHLHKTCASTPLRDIDGKVIRAWGMGCLHTRTPDYMPGASHTLGFAVVEYDSDGSGHFTIYNYLLDDNYKVRM